MPQADVAGCPFQPPPAAHMHARTHTNTHMQAGPHLPCACAAQLLLPGAARTCPRPPGLRVHTHTHTWVGRSRGALPFNASWCAPPCKGAVPREAGQRAYRAAAPGLMPFAHGPAAAAAPGLMPSAHGPAAAAAPGLMPFAHGPAAAAAPGLMSFAHGPAAAAAPGLVSFAHSHVAAAALGLVRCALRIWLSGRGSPPMRYFLGSAPFAYGSVTAAAWHARYTWHFHSKQESPSIPPLPAVHANPQSPCQTHPLHHRAHTHTRPVPSSATTARTHTRPVPSGATTARTHTRPVPSGAQTPLWQHMHVCVPPKHVSTICTPKPKARAPPTIEADAPVHFRAHRLAHFGRLHAALVTAMRKLPQRKARLGTQQALQALARCTPHLPAEHGRAQAQVVHACLRVKNPTETLEGHAQGSVSEWAYGLEVPGGVRDACARVHRPQLAACSVPCAPCWAATPTCALHAAADLASYEGPATRCFNAPRCACGTGRTTAEGGRVRLKK